MVWGGWDFVVTLQFIKVDPNQPNMIWFGGENAIFHPILYKSSDSGLTWQDADAPGKVEDRCHDMAIFRGNSNLAIMPMEGSIQRTEDGGEYWTMVHTNGLYMYSTRIDSMRPNLVYTCGTHVGDPMNIIISRDSGQTWTTVAGSLEGVDLIARMEILSLWDRNELYFAATTGVLKYTDYFPYLCGDPDNSGAVNILDISFLINYLYRGGSAPLYLIAGDVDSSGRVNILDISYLIRYLYRHGAELQCQ
jgi:hypothetical protein